MAKKKQMDFEMSVIEEKTPVTELKIEAGKMYINAKDIWAINTQQVPNTAMVYCRNEIFKVPFSHLVIFDNGSEVTSE